MRVPSISATVIGRDEWSSSIIVINMTVSPGFRRSSSGREGAGSVMPTGARTDRESHLSEVDAAVRTSPRRRRISAEIAGTTWWRSPMTASAALATMFACASVLIARIRFDAIAPTQCWIAPEIPHAM